MPKHETFTILVDMDGVLADFDSEVLARIENRHPHIPILDIRKNFYVADDYPDHAELVRSISDERGFFDSLPVSEGALEGWQRILDSGYLPRICSSPIRTNPTSTTEKLGWLKRHFAPIFGESVITQAVITRDKHLVNGIALIDDRPEVKNADLATWQHIVFDKPYNQGGDKLRICGWQDLNLEQIFTKTTQFYMSLGNQAIND